MTQTALTILLLGYFNTDYNVLCIQKNPIFDDNMLQMSFYRLCFKKHHFSSWTSLKAQKQYQKIGISTHLRSPFFLCKWTPLCRSGRFINFRIHSNWKPGQVSEGGGGGFVGNNLNVSTFV